MTRADRLSLVRQLAQEDLSQRQIAARLGVSKDTVRRDLEKIAAQGEPGDAPPTSPADPDAPQVSEDIPHDPAPQDAPHDEPVAQLPDPHAGIDVSQCLGLRHDLALLAQTGKSHQALVYQAVITLARAYWHALESGEIAPGVPFTVTSLQLTPLPHRAVPAEAG
ncbi:DeoR family transcriptional regulator [Streptomyces chartreusis]|uniref:DeoR family transcriptional regulator n=1 Tax=Streptomyces chartreusis TaxID=1969 RepID=UPI003868D0A9|nr:DeoR family transcriptional regulator [Streptomyces chartreusis]